MADDTVSMAAWSQASETDRILFSVLSNTDRIDLASLPRVAVDGPTTTTQGGPRLQDNNDLPRIVEETPVVEEVMPTRVFGDPEPPPYAADAAPPAAAASSSSVPRIDDDVTTAPPPVHPSSDLPLPPPPAYTPYDEVPTSRPAAPPVDDFPPVPPPPTADLGGDSSLPPAPSAPSLQPSAVLPPPTRSLEEERELELQKRTVLIDLQRLEMQGVRLTKQWDMSDPLEDMTLELRKHILIMDEQQNVSMLRDGLKMCVTAIEMVNNRLGLLDLEGWSSEVSRDMNKHNANLARIYRKYWRRSVSNTPEADIAFSILGSMGMHHVKRTMSKQMLSRGRGGGASAPPPRKAGSHSNNMFRRSASARPPRNDDGLSSSSDDDDEAPPRRT